jgi:hypothetical protein
VATPMNDKLLLGAGRGKTEHAALLFVGPRDVREPPRRPQLLRHVREPTVVAAATCSRE